MCIPGSVTLDPSAAAGLVTSGSTKIADGLELGRDGSVADGLVESGVTLCRAKTAENELASMVTAVVSLVPCVDANVTSGGLEDGIERALR